VCCFAQPFLLYRLLILFISYAQQGGAFQLDESASYLFDGLARISADNYMPTNADILRCRTRTTGVDEAIFVFEVRCSAGLRDESCLNGLLPAFGVPCD
jgi:hypothetical protein